MKILFSSVGRRVELMQCFKAAADELGTDLIIYGADASITAPAMYFAISNMLFPESVPRIIFRLCWKYAETKI